MDRSDARNMFQTVALAAISVASIAAIALFVLSSGRQDDSPSDRIRNATAHVSTVPPGGILARVDELAVWALDNTYSAAGDSQSAGASAKLQIFSSGEALKKLSDGRITKTGLEGWPEGFHETEILTIDASLEDHGLVVDAAWRPVALIADDGHRHRWGNTFQGRLVFDWASTSWRLMDISLSSVDKDGAGQVVDVEQN